ncbi:GNAT family N-acetyltransferase [Phototrophicus methaneseepsis]|uniref:GNAT family N-acetyltransferase n=1 Tax=Phototrophicus methaneseepsis TaxID=2710758 RepID=A0A7S8ECQ8_9CHLR|nr:GNAT family N-acetyltransferase [Phototrophicus methaneseepsis]QPC84536.1 GNAT family N-acetyltransferase [Phototrophicus methaneseepsis]
MDDKIQIRPLHAEDRAFLNEALYYAIFVPPEATSPPKTIVQQPDLVRYIEGFGTWDGDLGILAVSDMIPVGAAWARFVRGYGFVDENIPELSISIIPGYRGGGIGTTMLQALFAQLKGKAQQVSLSVNLANPAYYLYKRLGFEVVATDGNSVIMLRNL